MGITEEMFYLIRYEIKGEPLPNNIEFDIKRIFAISKKHDIAHLVSNAIIKNGIVLPNSEGGKELEKTRTLAVYREVQTNYLLNRIRKILKEGKIAYIPLKGAVIRNYYPEPWMRTSCDIDVLIHEEDIDKATNALLKNGFTTDGKRNYHDISFYFGESHLELHFNICENNKQIDGLLSKIWNYIKPISEYEYCETPEFFVFHHIAHMAYHFLSGGCGIRPFIDLWIMRQKALYNDNELIALLNECNLKPFYNAVCGLSDVWLDNKEHSELTLSMEKYVINGGVYGSANNENMVGSVTSKGKKKFLLKIAFPPYKTMCILYPSLKRHKLLLPFYYVHRACVKLFGKDKKKVKARINNTMAQSKEEIFEFKKLLNSLEINK